MKLKATTLVLGLCFSVLAVAASPAYARSTTAFSAFHVEAPVNLNPYKCLYENNGAVVNNCTFKVSLEFDLPIDNQGTKEINVQNGWFGTGAEETFSCTSYAYGGMSGRSLVGTTIDFGLPSETGTTTVDVIAPLTSIQVICWNIPPGGGVANFVWNQ